MKLVNRCINEEIFEKKKSNILNELQRKIN
jgi:hypothetical protein